MKACETPPTALEFRVEKRRRRSKRTYHNSRLPLIEDLCVAVEVPERVRFLAYLSAFLIA
jgi:hypothetical protein